MDKFYLDETSLGLLKKGIIDVSGKVEGEMAGHIRKCLMILKSKGNPGITFEITSNGGDVDVGLAIFDMLRLYEGKKTGRVIGYARSMAVVILQACDKRLCARHSSIMIHHVSRGQVSLDVMRNEEKMKRTLEDLEKLQGRIYDVLCNKTKKSRTVIKKVCEEEQDMTAEEALKFGLIDKII